MALTFRNYIASASSSALSGKIPLSSSSTSVRAIGRFKSVKRGPVKEVKRIYSRIVENEICPGFKDAVGVTPVDFLGNLNILDDEDSADADILRRMVVKARINVHEPEVWNDSLIEIRTYSAGSSSTARMIHPTYPTGFALRVVPRGFCYCTACHCELISTGSSSSMWMTRNPRNPTPTR